MRRTVIGLFLFALVLVVSIAIAPVLSAAGPQWVVVTAGDTLFSIAARNGTTVEVLMRLNNLPNANFVYSGQRLMLPDPRTGGAAPAPAPAKPVASNPAANAKPQPSVAIVYYTVRPGDTLAAIAARYGISTVAIAQANGLTDTNFIFYGQRLRIPGATTGPGVSPPPLANPPAAAAPPNANPPAPPLPALAENPPTTDKWIDVNVTEQTITAFEGSVPLKTLKVSTGLPRTPTVLGQYKIYKKYKAVRMTGGTPGIDYYDLPNVPWTMFFFKGYAIHGTYWHHNFGHPMSHGCVNLPTADAKWFYDWAPQGTLVVTHK